MIFVSDGFMLPLELRSLEVVGREFVSHNYVNRFIHVLGNDVIQGALRNVLSANESQWAATLPNTNYDLFLGSATAFLSALPTANIRFVHFDSTGKFFFLSFYHCGPDAMAEVPSCFVADTQHALHLVSGMAFSGFTNQVSCEEPFVQR